MRYAIVSETWAPEVNGVALTVQSLEAGLRARGHAVSVVRPMQPGMTSCAVDETVVPGFRLPLYAGLRAGRLCPGKLRKLWSQCRPDAVYIATEGPLGWSALRAACALEIPVATGFHTRFDEYMRDYGLPWLEPVAMRWMRRFHNRADATLIPTRELQQALIGLGFRNPTLLSRAVDTQLFDPARRDANLRRQWGLRDNDLAVIHVGRIAVEKNLGLAVSAFRKLQEQRPDARFVWVGDGPLREQLARENPDFLFTGIQRGESLARHFASADLFLFSSRSETFGNVTLESMACGVPLVAFDYGAAREHLRDGEHGAAVATGNDHGFIAAACAIAGDDALRTSMGAAARGAVRHLSPQRVAEQFDELLFGLAQGKNLHARLYAA